MWGANHSLSFGVLPVASFASGHTFFVQRLFELQQVKPYVVHTTFQYGGSSGKRHRLREAMLWVDPPEYYEGEGCGFGGLGVGVGVGVCREGEAVCVDVWMEFSSGRPPSACPPPRTHTSPPAPPPHPLAPSLCAAAGRFLSVDLVYPETPAGFQQQDAVMMEGQRFKTDWNDNDMVDWHLKAVGQQLKQLRTALKLAVALNRTMIMPKVRPGAVGVHGIVLRGSVSTPRSLAPHSRRRRPMRPGLPLSTLWRPPRVPPWCAALVVLRPLLGPRRVLPDPGGLQDTPALCRAHGPHPGWVRRSAASMESPFARLQFESGGGRALLQSCVCSSSTLQIYPCRSAAHPFTPAEPFNFVDNPGAGGPAIPFREYSFLSNERTPDSVKVRGATGTD